MERQRGQLIWEGRLHLGDNPGVCGDAAYAGLRVEFPLTLHRFGPKAAEPDDISFLIKLHELSADCAVTRPHVALHVFEPGRVRGAGWDRAKAETTVQFDGSMVRLRPVSVSGKRYFAVSVEVDIGPAPGLYNDFVLVSLTLESTTHYAEFGFRAGNGPTA
jgi:hypothetical protein